MDNVDVKGWQDLAVNVSLTRNQIKAIEALLSCQTVEESADMTGVSERTVYRWLKEENFQQALQFAIREAAGSTLRRLVAGRQKALDNLYALLDSEDERVQLAAIKEWLSNTSKDFETAEILDRLSEIEQRLNG